MCQRLLDLKYPLTVLANRTQTHVYKAVSRGANEVKTAKALAEASDVVMLCMDTSGTVRRKTLNTSDGVDRFRSIETIVIYQRRQNSKLACEQVIIFPLTLLSDRLGSDPIRRLLDTRLSL